MAADMVRKEQERAELVILLAWVAGGVDAVGYLALLHLFTAHMSGNSAAMGAHLGQADWREALHRALPIPFFVLGVMVGTTCAEMAVRMRFRAPFSLVLCLEMALLIGFLLCDSSATCGGSLPKDTVWKFYVLIALPALAMGVQNATLRRVGGQGVRTTYISGVLTSFAEAGVHYLFRVREQLQGRSRERSLQALRISVRNEARNHMLLLGSIWCAFVTGAVIGGFFEQRWQLRALVFPLGGLAVIMALDLMNPVQLTGAEKSTDGGATSAANVTKARELEQRKEGNNAV